MNQAQDTRLPALPELRPGVAVGFRGTRCRVVFVRADGRRVKLQPEAGPRLWADREELTAPPPVAAHIGEAGRELGALFGGGWRDKLKGEA